MRAVSFFRFRGVFVVRRFSFVVYCHLIVIGCVLSVVSMACSFLCVCVVCHSGGADDFTENKYRIIILVFLSICVFGHNERNHFHSNRR